MGTHWIDRGTSFAAVCVELPLRHILALGLVRIMYDEKGGTQKTLNSPFSGGRQGNTDPQQ